MTDQFSGLQLQSTIDVSGTLTIDLVDVTVGAPGPDEVVVQVEAAPINPSDLALLLGPADLDTLTMSGSRGRPSISAQVPAEVRGLVSNRIGMAITPGNEGAGRVVAAGSNARDLVGKRVGMWGGAMYAQYRKLSRNECVLLPEDATAAEGASIFVNPLTALAFVETMRLENHTGIVHLAAASNLGQMLNRVCIKEDIPLVNIVRKPEQATLLRNAGARYVLDSSADGYEDALVEALYETGATIAFDPIRGGRSACQILAAMEAAAVRNETGHIRYGTDVLKQVYNYGTFDFSPVIIDRWFGFAWSLGGWLLTPRLRQLGPQGIARLQARVISELKTTFASHYTAGLSLAKVLDPDTIRAFSRKATGEKYLIEPQVE